MSAQSKAPTKREGAASRKRLRQDPEKPVPVSALTVEGPSPSSIREELRARIAPDSTPPFWGHRSSALGVLGADEIMRSIGKTVCVAIRDMNSSFESGLQDVQRFRRLAHVAIDSHADRLVQQLTAEQTAKAFTLERQLETVDSLLESLRREHAAARDAAESLSDADLVARHPELSARLDAVDASLRELPTVPLESSALCAESFLPSFVSYLAFHSVVHAPSAASDMFNHGLSLLLGRGCIANAVAAFSVFNHAAAAGNTTAAGYIAQMVSDGVVQDRRSSRWLFELAASKGDVFSRAVVLLYGWGVPREERASLQLMMRAASGGHALAENAVGDALMHGIGCENDPAVAVTWYQRSAEQGYAIAQHVMGCLYTTGEGVAKDLVQAIAWYRRSAGLGFAPAQFFLGYAYENGEGVEKDPLQAIAWYRQAADRGYCAAMRCLVHLYLEGANGVEVDPTQAFAWCHRAAILGDVQAQFALSFFFRDGYGVSQDAAAELYWLRCAASQGHEKAVSALAARNAQAQHPQVAAQ
jgi:uncharacterized protein